MSRYTYFTVNDESSNRYPVTYWPDTVILEVIDIDDSGFVFSERISDSSLAMRASLHAKSPLLWGWFPSNVITIRRTADSFWVSDGGRTGSRIYASKRLPLALPADDTLKVGGDIWHSQHGKGFEQRR